MEWTDEAFVLSARLHGEGAAVVSLMTRDHGRHPGLVHAATAKRMRSVLQPGNAVHSRWRARLADHLGTLSCELTDSVAAEVLGDPLRLAGLASACAIVDTALPERQSFPRVFDALAALLTALRHSEVWSSAYVKWELGMLAELGFGLDFRHCAVTGSNDRLTYVSPRTGRAVSESAAEPYRDRLLPLPAFLLEQGSAGDTTDVAQGLALTGHFLERCVYAVRDRGLPAARGRLLARL